MERVIYEKKDDALFLSNNKELKSSRLPKTATELLDYLEKNTSYEPIQERIDNSKTFIAQVISITKELGMDVTIIEKENRIEATMPLYILGLELYCKSAFERVYPKFCVNSNKWRKIGRNNIFGVVALTPPLGYSINRKLHACQGQRLPGRCSFYP